MKFISDRRRSERISDQISFRYHLLSSNSVVLKPEQLWQAGKEAPQQVAHSQMVNLSTTGMAFHVSDAIQLTTKIALELTLSTSQQKVYLIGTIIGCLTASGFSVPIYELRIKFEEVSEETKKALVTYIDKKISASLK